MKRINLSRIIFIGMIAVLPFLQACEEDVCKDVICENGGTPTAVLSSCLCDCPAGFSGDLCEIVDRAKFLSTSGGQTKWDGLDTCTSGQYSYNADIDPSSSNMAKIIITNFGGFGTTTTVSADVSGSTFSNVGPVTLAGVTVTNITGTINAGGDTITIGYSANDGVNPVDVCTGIWVKF